MRLRSSALLASLVSSIVACSSSSSGTGAGSGGSGPADATTHYEFTFTTHAGEETHWCQYARMPQGDGQEVVVTGYTWDWQNMHHWALYRTTADLPANVSFDEPFDCFAPGGMKYAAPASLVLGAGAHGSQAFPAGTGFGFKPGEVVIFQAHTLNTTSADVEAKMDIGVDTAPPKDVEHRLGLVQFYDPFIVVPAHMAAKAQMRCKVPEDMTIVQGTTHEHTRGKKVSVFLDPPGAAPATTPFLESTDWEHPTVNAGPLSVAKGSYLRTLCDYQGDGHDVIQGQTKQDNEMCMFIGYYYPVLEGAQGGLFENCVPDSYEGGVGDGYGTGDKNCSDSLKCIQSCPAGDAPAPRDGRIDVGKCWQSCMVDSCPTAAAPLDKLGACVNAKCAKECAGGNCPACVLKSCGAEYGACSSHTCQ